VQGSDNQKMILPEQQPLFCQVFDHLTHAFAPWDTLFGPLSNQRLSQQTGGDNRRSIWCDQ
jgi:hypothetical protein